MSLTYHIQLTFFLTVYVCGSLFRTLLVIVVSDWLKCNLSRGYCSVHFNPIIIVIICAGKYARDSSHLSDVSKTERGRERERERDRDNKTE